MNIISIIKNVFFLSVFFLINSNVSAQIWKEAPLHRLTAEEYKMTLDFWAKKFKDRLTVEEIGKTAEGTGIFLLKITDKKTQDNNKQVALISALHGGPERSGTTGVLALTEWLLSDDREAIETRRKQVVLVIPIINPYSYFVTDKFYNSKNIDPYTAGGASNWDFETLTYKKADEVPEVMAYLKVVDKYKPEVNLDLHGTGLQEYSREQIEENKHLSYRGQIMFEVTGTAYSNSVLRPWDWRITEAMVEAGKEAGFPTDRAEADAQQMQWIPGTANAEGQAWRGRPQFYLAQYAYLKYHTLLACLEVAWEESAVARSKGMLRLGNKVWPGEKREGYPVNRIHGFVGRYVTPWGKTAQALRESRTELWQKQASFSHGVIYPETEKRASFVVGLTSEGSQMLNENLQVFVTNLKKYPDINADAIDSFIRKGPEIKLAFERGKNTSFQKGRITGGFGLRLRLPYADANIGQLRLNGHLLKPGAEDGYETWIGDGYRQVQINVPPSKAANMDIAVVTCEYDTKTKRNHGWTPPREVLNKLK